jgi:micrococcal nuclease
MSSLVPTAAAVTVTPIRQGWTVPATVVRVIDGDTLQADLDLGWGVILRKATIRVADINCPELSTAAGVTAAARTTALLPAGTPVQVISHKRDKYGRVLASILWQDNDGTTVTRHDLGQTLLAENLAVPFMVEKNDVDPAP